MLPDGGLIHLGRKDARLKIRGNRIEVAEIEMTLLQHAAVKEAVVVGQDDERGEKRLIAYITAKPGAEAAAPALRAFLQTKLPSYMVPASFVRLDTLPVNANGKVDRQALAITKATDRTADNFVAPANDLENTIAGIWSEVLRVDKVGVHDNFFDLGGNSLLLIEAHAKLSTVSSKTFSVTDLFEYPTIHSLAGFLRGAAEDGATASGRERGVELRAGRDRLRKQADARREKA
jgi:non-ribosomal peptide synthetase component F